MHRIKLISILIFLIHFICLSQTSVKFTDSLVNEILRYALIETPGYNYLRDFCSIGHRLSGSDNLEKAIIWSKTEMEKIGCDKVWLQPVNIPHWVRGNSEKAEIIFPSKFNKRKIKIASLGNSISTPNSGLTGEVIEVKSYSELISFGDKVKGKIVFFNRPLDRGKVNTFEGYGGAVDQRSMGAIWAAQYGGVAALVRSVTTLNDNVPHVGSMHYLDTIPKIPAISISSLDADYLSNSVKEHPSLKLYIKTSCLNLPEVNSFNVIGEIKGVSKPDEIIVVGGHIDSWDFGQGAHDDGAGCIHSLEVLKILKYLNLKPSRTIRCVLFANEENGSSGARAFAKYVDSLGEKVIFAIESDRGGFTPRGFSVDADSLTINNFQKYLPFLKKAGIEWIKKGGSGVDISRIKNAKALFGFVPDEQRYMDVHHSANDTFDKVHPREFELGSTAITILTYLLSEFE